MGKKMKKRSPAAVDRISELPEEIIHLILSSLNSHKSAARTSILSTRWLHLWRTYPVVEFNGRRIKEFLSKFQSFTAATSKRLLSEPLLLDSFTIQLGDQLSTMVRRQLQQHGDDLRNCLYQSLKSGSSGSPLKNSCLDNLQELSLDRVQVVEKSFHRCLANAPRLEKLSLVLIGGIHKLDISASNSPSLKYLSFHGDYLQQLQLTSAPLLETFHFRGHCKCLNVVSAPNVKFIELRQEYSLEREGEIEELISKFPSLQSLHFHMVQCKEKLRISAHTLRKLTIRKSFLEMMAFEIDAPNLVTLTINSMVDLSTMKFGPKINSTVVNVSPSCRCVFACTVFRGAITTSWLIELRKYLAVLAKCFHSLVFKLDIPRSIKVSSLDLNQVGCESSPLIVQHLLLGVDEPLIPTFFKSDEARLLDGLLWTIHPKTLSIADSNTSRSLFSYISKQIETKILNKCCSNDKCWRHQFKDAKIRSVTVDNVSKIHKSMISQPSIDMIFLIRRDPRLLTAFDLVNSNESL
ncbi:F-box/FBD/LRR-repeat protein At5g53840 [Linum perenne]